MIGKVSGLVDYVADDHALIDAGGVGYIVYAAPRTLARLPAPGGRTALYTELVVREDLMQLFGFQTLLEREWHKLLTSVQGVGAKASLSILDTLGAEGLGRAIAAGDANAVKAAQGVGPKLAQRVVNELKAKAPNVTALGARAAREAAPSDAAPDAVLVEPEAPAESVDGSAPTYADEAAAVSALENLGFPAAEAVAAVSAAAAGLRETGDAPSGPEPLIAAALKRLGPPG